jgi:twitching motility protein PilT
VDEQEDSPQPQTTPAGAKTPRMEGYFRAMMKATASDLHLKAGSAPFIRTRTEIVPTTSDPLTPEQIEAMGLELMTPAQKQRFDADGAIDLAYEIDGFFRFRLNIFRQRGMVSIAVRRVPGRVRDFESLHLPPICSKIAEEQTGLVLLSGPAGSGKSTTIAAMLEQINKTRPCHIVTLEDPIEFVYQSKLAVITQREIGTDVPNFDLALKYLMHQDPDVVLIGEMRDRETFRAALNAAETGHLVFGTIHAATAPQTIERVLALFPVEERDIIRQSLAFNLRAVVCQRLLPSLVEGVDRIPAVEVLLSNPTVRQLIDTQREAELADVIRANERDGMQSFTLSLKSLIEREAIDPRVAYEVAVNPDELKMLLRGISAGRSGLIGH